MSTEKPTELPFHVRTVPGGVFHSGHSDEEGAKAAASLANDDAQKLGIATRYEAGVKP